MTGNATVDIPSIVLPQAPKRVTLCALDDVLYTPRKPVRVRVGSLEKRKGVRAFLPFPPSITFPFACLLPAPVRGRAQLLNFCFQVGDLFLLLLDRIEHRPEDRIAFDHQIAGTVPGHSFRNNLLQ